MDELFSSIQQNLQNNDKTSLLQKQQVSQDKINELLEKSAEAMMCGPTCQKLKITEELKQKYLDAQTNIQTAPTKLEQTKKNYYIYSEGRPYYDNMLEEELTQKSEKISILLSENFNDEIAGALTMNNYLNTALINSSYTKELLDDYTEKNKEVKLLLRDRHGDILTNDRKTYYEADALQSLKKWYRLWWYLYYILVIVLVLAFILSPSKIDVLSIVEINGKRMPMVNIDNIIKKTIVIILFIFYPYYIDYIVNWIKGVFLFVYNRIPKNVYNNL
jgi:hypothetical protein